MSHSCEKYDLALDKLCRTCGGVTLTCLMTLMSVFIMCIHTKRIHPQTIPEIQQHIDTYIRKFESFYPGKLLPKHHILHKHCIPYIIRHGFGLGLMGEQGTEASHQTIARISERAVAIKDPLKKLQFIMHTHYLDVSPTLKIKREKRRRVKKQ